MDCLSLSTVFKNVYLFILMVFESNIQGIVVIFVTIVCVMNIK
jgi:hypothetical protein